MIHCHLLSVVVCYLVLQLFLLCQIQSDFDKLGMNYMLGKRLQSYRADFEYLHKLCLLRQMDPQKRRSHYS